MKTLNPPKIVSLAQLMLLPIGTVVSPLKQSIGRLAHFDCQGTLEVQAQATLVYVADHNPHVILLDLLPDIFISEGNIRTRESRTHYFGSQFPFRFVVWSEPE